MMAPAEPFPALMVRQNAADEVVAAVESLCVDDLPAGEVLIEVACSSLNYKDALAIQGHPGVVRRLPHVPGIDCAGVVAQSSVPEYQQGDPVLATGYDFGSAHWGGYAAYARVPAEWIVRLPKSLTPEEAMTYGTAGFTAAQCVSAIQKHGVRPGDGPVVVSGASGGVASVAIAILAKLGYTVTAITGKQELSDQLSALGASEILPREALQDESDKPLLPSRWAAAVDTVGGNPLSTILRSTNHRGIVAACGLAASAELSITVHPFILRGVTLAGIDSAKCPRQPRLEMWRLLAGEWNVSEKLRPLASTIHLAELAAHAEAMLAAKKHGRTLVVPTAC